MDSIPLSLTKDLMVLDCDKVKIAFLKICAKMAERVQVFEKDCGMEIIGQR
jgi:hypothetical protein